MTVRASLILLALSAANVVVGADEASFLEKGATEWGLVGGFGVAHPIWGGKAERQFALLGARLGKVVSGPVGPSFLKGNLTVSVEILPAIVMFQEATTYAVSATLLLRHYFAPRSLLKPFISVGAGPLVSVEPIPSGTTRLNFTPQAGLGVAIFHKRNLALLFEYRLHHISNASLATPNPGINSSYFQFEVRVRREK